MPLRENRLTWAGSPLACSESGLIRHDIEEEVALFGTWLYLTHSVINSLREFIVLLGVTVSFSFLCPFSKRKARVSGAVFISMTLSAASPAAWKSSRPWREDPLLARARHVDVFARGEREKIFLWRQGDFVPQKESSTEEQESGLSGGCKSKFFTLHGKVRVQFADHGGES